MWGACGRGGSAKIRRDRRVHARHRERHRTRYRLWFALVTSERNASSGLGPRGIIPRGLPGEVWRGGGGGRGGTISGQSTVFDGGG